VASTVDRYLAVGVPAAKLGIGLGFYGTCWKGASQPRVAQTTTTARVGNDNNMSYATILSSYYEGTAKRWDAAAGVPYLTFSSPKGPNGCNFVSYEDEQSIAAKGDFARARGLGGAIVWTIAEGHLPAAPLGSRDPLLAAAARSFLAQ
jgi:chitinase